MLKIRLAKVGSKQNKAYRVVVIEKRSKTKGKAIDILGSYNPVKEGISLNKEKLRFWLLRGAKPSKRLLKLI